MSFKAPPVVRQGGVMLRTALLGRMTCAVLLVARALGSRSCFISPTATPRSRAAVCSDAQVHGTDSRGDGERVVELIIARHGETNFNRDGRIQGMTDLSRLTEKGREQAQALGRALAAEGKCFDRIYVSPLARARHTYDSIEGEWRAMGFKDYPIMAPTFLPSLQEIELYHWHGHLKSELQEREAAAMQAWQTGDPRDFRLGDRYPIRELWERARKALRVILKEALDENLGIHTDGDDKQRCVLVVAHNAINQALIGSLLARDETFYRKLSYPNCGALHVRVCVQCPSLHSSADEQRTTDAHLGDPEEQTTLDTMGESHDILPVVAQPGGVADVYSSQSWMSALGKQSLLVGHVGGDSEGQLFRAVHPSTWAPQEPHALKDQGDVMGSVAV